MVNSKLPRRLAIAGLVVGIGFMAMWWCIYKYNPSYLPSPYFLQNLTCDLFPLLWLTALTAGGTAAVNYTIWILAILLDCVILYFIGVAINAMRLRISARRPRAS